MDQEPGHDLEAQVVGTHQSKTTKGEVQYGGQKQLQNRGDAHLEGNRTGGPQQGRRTNLLLPHLLRHHGSHVHRLCHLPEAGDGGLRLNA